MIKTCNVVILSSKSGIVVPNSLAKHSQTKELVYNTFDAQFISGIRLLDNIYIWRAMIIYVLVIGLLVINPLAKLSIYLMLFVKIDLGWATTQTRTLCDCHKIIASTDNSISYPFAESVLIPDSFIVEFCINHHKIKDVDIELEDIKCETAIETISVGETCVTIDVTYIPKLNHKS